MWHKSEVSNVESRKEELFGTFSWGGGGGGRGNVNEKAVEGVFGLDVTAN